MTYYVENGPSTSCAADQPLHAGTARKSIQDNLLAVYEKGIDHQAHLTGVSDYVEADPATNSEWEALPLQVVPVPVYPAEGGGFRDLRISFEALVSGSQATVRAYLLPSPTVRTVDVTDGIEGYDTYADESVAALVWTEYTFDDITPDETCVRWVDASTVAAGAALAITYIKLIYKIADATKLIDFRGLRVREV